MTLTATAPREVLLSVRGVGKSFAGVRALDGVSIEVRAGEVHALVGENGAGKSTLMAIASGAMAADVGKVEVCGSPVSADPGFARRAGLAIVRQEPALMPDLTVAENLWLGVAEDHRPRLAQLNAWAAGLLCEWNESGSVRARSRVARLDAEQRFAVEIVKALAGRPRVLILDEPTEHLAALDVARLFARVRRLAAGGAAVVYISHRIREVRTVADRITVLRDGRGQGTHAMRALTEDGIVALIVGSALDRDFPAKAADASMQPESLVVRGLSGRGFSSVDVLLRRGEILGLAGIEGNGQREFLRCLAGLRAGTGIVTVNGIPMQLGGVARAQAQGVRYLPGDRHRDGLFAPLDVRENYALRGLGLAARYGIVDERREAAATRDALRRFDVRAAGIEAPIGSLSGGNQQKLMLAGVLDSAPALLLVEEPTNGVDVGTRVAIYRLLREAAARGVPIVVLSSDAGELAGLCDKVAVFSRGHVVQRLADDNVTEADITATMLTATRLRERPAGSVGAGRVRAEGDLAPLLMLAFAIVALGAYASEASPYYLSARNLGGLLVLTATLAFVAYGQQALMLVGGIDLSVGALMGLVQVIASYLLVAEAGIAGQFAGGLTIVLACLGIGLVNWLLVDALGLHPMIATLASAMAIQAVSLMLRPMADGLFDERLTEAIDSRIGFVPLTVIVAAATALLLEGLLRCHRLGLAWRAAGSNADSARLAGIATRRVRLAAYLGCSLLSGLAAVTMLSQVGIGDPRAGLGYTLASVAAVVVGGASLAGGRGSFVGAGLGAAFVTQINGVASFLDLDPAWQSYLLGGMVLAAVAVYSGSRQRAAASS